MNCYLCHQNNTKSIYKINSRTIFSCLNDGLFFAIDKKSEKFQYDNDYYESSPYNQKQIFNDIYFQEKLDKVVGLSQEKRPNILDVGCGWGNFLTVVRNNKLPYFGIDLSNSAINICCEKGLNCQKADLIKLSKLTGQKYSIITFFQVIEHLRDPIIYLQAAKKLLKKNGVLLITTPNNDSPFRYLFGPNWSVYNTQSHYFFYAKESLQKLLKSAGFANFNVKVDRFRFFSLDYVLQRLFKKKLTIPQIINVPIPTDPWGDLEAIAVNK